MLRAANTRRKDLGTDFSLEEGVGLAMHWLGLMYLHGLDGAQRNLQEAVQWFTASAQGGSMAGLNTLGSLYESGLPPVIQMNKDLARQLYELAAEKGETIAMTNLAKLYLRGNGVPLSFLRAREWYSRAALAGDDSAAAELESLPALKYTLEEDARVSASTPACPLLLFTLKFNY